ncbi:MAG: HmuY family protein [Treponema sp.]|jgi:hypothetical protein|nr:HmuY family protein [Treponema sp.]
MKRSIISFLLVFGCTAMLLLACSPDSDNQDTGGEGTITFSVSTDSGPLYYSLTTGEPVTGDEIKSTKWDIGFQRSRLIYTNSGDTATKLGSGGQGGVWYTEKFAFDEVTQDDAVTDDATLLNRYTTDVKRWIRSMSLEEVCVNVIGYVGYGNETETGAGDDDQKPLASFQYNKKQFYKSKSYDPSKRVYIIKHGDGATYSKIQILEYESNTSEKSDTYVIKYAHF